LTLSKFFHLPTDAQENCFKKDIKNLHKNSSDMFWLNHHHQGAHYLSFDKVTVAKTIS